MDETTCKLGAWSCYSCPRQPVTWTWSTGPQRKISPAFCVAREHWPKSSRWSERVIWCITASWTYTRDCFRNPSLITTCVSATRSPCWVATICWPTLTMNCQHSKINTWVCHQLARPNRLLETKQKMFENYLE